MTSFTPTILCILDGWGLRADTTANAIAQARTPVWDGLCTRWPSGRLKACGPSVGLPAGQMGNSEVGHLNLGAGRVVPQTLPRIDSLIASDQLAAQPSLQRFISRLKGTGRTCHLLGLLSDGGVHAHIRHILALAHILSDARIPTVIHGFLDGRDTPPKHGALLLPQISQALAHMPTVQLRTLIGRYFAMDRDHRWDRTARAYSLIVDGAGESVRHWPDAIHAAHHGRDIGDEFVPAWTSPDYGGAQDGDGLMVANFRADRIRQLLAALTESCFSGFERARTVAFSDYLGMVPYSAELDQTFSAIVPAISLSDTLGSCVATAGLRQLRLAETEKYAHVTFFFSGGTEDPFPQEKRILVPSPPVATYDLQPEMSAPAVTDALCATIARGDTALCVVNFANGDMVGHTGSLSAAIAAVEAVDRCLKRVVARVLDHGAKMLVTADHGNCECMRDPVSQQAHTSHTLNDVPVILVNHPATRSNLRNGKLADIAPTVLAMMGLLQPTAMTGRSLLP